MVEMREIEAFLAVAAELHFGRAAQRLRVTTSHVSQTIRTLERRIGGQLLERTSRRVTLTPLGRHLREQLEPAHAQLLAAIAAARQQAAALRGELRIGYHSMTAGGTFAAVAGRFEDEHPECAVSLIEVPLKDPYAPLAQGDIDMLVSWRPVEAPPGLVVGAILDSQPHVLAVAADHPLVTKGEISIEQVPDWPLTHTGEAIHPALLRAIVPAATPGGRALRRAVTSRSLHDTVRLVATGRAVHLTVGAFRAYGLDDRVTTIAVPDLPPVDRVLLWRADDRSPQVRQFAAKAGTPIDGEV
ncbi:LysR family transcriptional regulator [Dactylosporangium salmoneum]|uniref:LysR family transcriptional regulator n=2 Tax=Dactylosporangium salmoneum TaxID=53361 RepID=A0ABP5TD75_9ACTN